MEKIIRNMYLQETNKLETAGPLYFLKTKT